MRSAFTKSSFHTGSSNESFAATTKAARRQGCQLRVVSTKRVPFTARSMYTSIAMMHEFGSSSWRTLVSM